MFAPVHIRIVSFIIICNAFIIVVGFWEIVANSREDVRVALTGDIIALAGLKDTITGETLCDPESPVVLERMDFPDPVIKIAIEPKTKADIDKMAAGLVMLAQEGPSFHFSRDEEINQIVIEGMRELHKWGMCI